MALNDWKLIKSENNFMQWEHQKHNSKFVFVSKQDYAYKKDIDWFFTVMENRKEIIEKPFKSKPQALHYAELYMRDN